MKHTYIDILHVVYKGLDDAHRHIYHYLKNDCT